MAKMFTRDVNAKKIGSVKGLAILKYCSFLRHFGKREVQAGRIKHSFVVLVHFIKLMIL